MVKLNVDTGACDSVLMRRGFLFGSAGEICHMTHCASRGGGGTRYGWPYAAPVIGQP